MVTASYMSGDPSALPYFAEVGYERFTDFSLHSCRLSAWLTERGKTAHRIDRQTERSQILFLKPEFPSRKESGLNAIEPGQHVSCIERKPDVNDSG